MDFRDASGTNSLAFFILTEEHIVTTSSRNFNIINVAQPNSTSDPASDLVERLLSTLNEVGPLPQSKLAAVLRVDSTEIQLITETLLNLKVVDIDQNSQLRISQSGKKALELNSLSVSR